MAFGNVYIVILLKTKNLLYFFVNVIHTFKKTHRISIIKIYFYEEKHCSLREWL